MSCSLCVVRGPRVSLERGVPSTCLPRGVLYTCRRETYCLHKACVLLCCNPYSRTAITTAYNDNVIIIVPFDHSVYYPRIIVARVHVDGRHSFRAGRIPRAANGSLRCEHRRGLRLSGALFGIVWWLEFFRAAWHRSSTAYQTAKQLYFDRWALCGDSQTVTRIIITCCRCSAPDAVKQVCAFLAILYSQIGFGVGASYLRLSRSMVLLYIGLCLATLR